MSTFERIFWFYGRMKGASFPDRRDFLDRFEVSESTFKRDMAFMRDRLGAPVEYDRERRGYFLSDESFEIPSFWFDRRQLLMLVGVSKQFEDTDGNGSGEISKLGEKLRGLLTMKDGRDISAFFSFENVEWVRCDCRTLDMLIEAMIRSAPVRFTYHTGGSDSISERVIEPCRIHYYMGSWYLVGFCRLKGEPRTFQLGRVSNAAVLDERFSAPGFDVEEYVGSSFGIFKGGKVETAVLRFDPFMGLFVKNEVWHDMQEMEVHEDGSVTLALPVADLTEIRRRVMQYGAHVEVLAPGELRSQVAEEAGKIMRIYQGNKGT